MGQAMGLSEPSVPAGRPSRPTSVLVALIAIYTLAAFTFLPIPVVVVRALDADHVEPWIVDAIFGAVFLVPWVLSAGLGVYVQLGRSGARKAGLVICGGLTALFGLLTLGMIPFTVTQFFSLRFGALTIGFANILLLAMCSTVAVIMLAGRSSAQYFRAG